MALSNLNRPAEGVGLWVQNVRALFVD